MTPYRAQIWDGILKTYAPQQPPFSHETVYAAWAEAHRAQRRLHDDQMESNIKLLVRAEKDKESPFKFDRILITPSGAYEVFAFALLSVPGSWGGPILELVMDSPCESN